MEQVLLRKRTPRGWFLSWAAPEKRRLRSCHKGSGCQGSYPMIQASRKKKNARLQIAGHGDPVGLPLSEQADLGARINPANSSLVWRWHRNSGQGVD